MRIILTLACAGGLVASSGAACLAQSLTQPSTPTGDLTGFSGDRQALPRVIARVETVTGGRVVEARYSRRGGEDGFDVLATKGGQLQYLRLARPDGPLQIIKEQDRPSWMLSHAKRDDLVLARQARIPLERAVLTAERTSGAPAVAAGLAPPSTSLSSIRAYNVLLDYPDGRTRRVAVDDDTGMVIRDPGVLGD